MRNEIFGRFYNTEKIILHCKMIANVKLIIEKSKKKH